MTREDASQIAAEVCTLYRSAYPWNKAMDPASGEATKLARHFAGYLPAKVLAAVKDHAYEDPKTPPTPAQITLRLKAQTTTVTTTLADPTTCNHPQPWAFEELQAQDGDSQPRTIRRAMCRYCHTEFDHDPQKLLTPLEEEERKRRRQEERIAR